MAMAGPYVPLRIFSSYTMLEGSIEPKAIAKQAKRLDFPAAALTDRNGLYAVMAFTDACREAGVQPIVGTMLGVARPDCAGGQPALDWIALYAQNDLGYGNLCSLVSAAHLGRPVEEPPHVTLDALAGRTDGLIALTAGADGALVRLIGQGQDSTAEPILERLMALFPGRLYIELSRRRNEDEERAEARLIELAYRYDLPLVATNPASYADAHFHEAHDALLCIAQSSQLDRDDRRRSSREDWLKPAAAMRELFADLPEARENGRRRPPLCVRGSQAQADPAEHCRRHGGRSGAAAPRRQGRPRGPPRPLSGPQRRGPEDLFRPARL
jgi:DNA polymerase-3 subunit alpha